MVNTSIVLLLCFCTELRVICPNHEVVVIVFQPWTGNAPYLGSVDNYIFYSNPPAPPLSTNFLDIFKVPIFPITPPWVFFLLVDPLYFTCSPLHILVWSTFHMSIVRTLHLSSFDACFCTLCCESASSRCPMNVLPPPLCLPRLATIVMMHNVMRFTQDIFSTDIWPMKMDYDVWIYNWIPNIQ